MDRSDGDVRRRFAPLFIAAAVAVMLINYIPTWWPMDRDSGVFAYAGRVILSGGMPYRDVWDHKPPGIYLADAAILATGVEPRWGVWAGSVVVGGAAAGVATIVLCEAFGPTWGLFGALLHAVVLVDPNVYRTNNLTELYGLLFQWLTLWGLIRSTRRPIVHLFAAGVAAGVAVSFKPTCSAIAVAAVADLLLWGGSRRWKGVGAFAAGAAVVPLLIVAWLGAGGVLAQAWDCVIVYNRAYVAADPLRQLGVAVYHCLRRNPINVLGLLTAGSLAVRGPLPAAAARPARIALLALPLELLFLALPGRFFGHYDLTLLPVLTLRSSAFAEAAAARLPAARARGIAAALVALCALRLCIVLAAKHPHARAAVERQQSEVEAVHAHSAPGQAVLVWGASLGINLLADRPAPSRYGYMYPLVTPGYSTEQMWRRFLSDLRAHPPALVVDTTARDDSHTPVPSLREVGSAEVVPPGVRNEVRSFVRGYRQALSGDGFELWVPAATSPLQPTARKAQQAG